MTDDTPATTDHASHPPWLLPVFGALIVLLVVANNIGNATWACAVTGSGGNAESWLCQQSWMAWINGNPLGLLALNSSNKYLLATSVVTDFWPVVVISTLRLMAPDPLFFILGWTFGPRAVHWARNVFPGSQRLFDMIEEDAGSFRRVLSVLVFLIPNNPVCLLAGVARFPVRRFIVLSVLGTIGRVVLFRFVGYLFEDQIRDLLDVVAQYQKWFTMASIGFVVAYVMWQAVGRKGLIGGVEELEEEFGDE